MFRTVLACWAVWLLGGLGVGSAAAEPLPGLLIVTPRALEEEVRRYAAAREGLRVEVRVLEEVLAGHEGVDDAERLKRGLYTAWREGGGALRYVLLVGDADVMPVRYMCLDRNTEAAFNYAFYPSDLYYADLAEADGRFEDWNAVKEGFHAGYFGEVRGEHYKDDPINFDQVDYKPEVAVGRWPVSSVEEVRIIAEKSLAHERAAAEGRPIVGLVATGGWIENRPAMEAFAERLAGAWTIEKRYWSGGKREYGTPPPDEAQVLEIINRGAALVLHSGHGEDHRWDGSINVGSIAKMSNAARPVIMMSAGCSTARLATLPPYEAYVDVDGRAHAGTVRGEVFTAPPPPPACYQRGAHNPTGLGEQLLRAGPNGAAAYIGCNTGSQPCGMTLMEGFVERIAAGEQRLGDCWRGAIEHYWERQRLADLKPTESWYPASIFFQGMKFVVFGDPSLRVAAGADEERKAKGE